MIEQGADVNAQDKGGLIPLHNASSYGHVDIASLLINNNSLVNATDRLVGDYSLLKYLLLLSTCLYVKNC